MNRYAHLLRAGRALQGRRLAAIFHVDVGAGIAAVGTIGGCLLWGGGYADAGGFFLVGAALGATMFVRSMHRIGEVDRVLDGLAPAYLRQVEADIRDEVRKLRDQAEHMRLVGHLTAAAMGFPEATAGRAAA